MVNTVAPEQTEVTDPPKRGRGRPRNPRPEPQTGFEETIIIDQRIVDDLEVYMENAEAAKMANGAKRRIKSLLKENGYVAGRYRIGAYIVDIKELTGGEFFIPAWKAMAFSVGGGEDSGE